MSIIINLIRNALGGILVLVDLITRPRRLKRSAEAQATVEKAQSELCLYQLFACPFCIKTRRAMHKLNLSVEKRSVAKGSPYREELAQQGGKIQSPCLRIEKDGKVEWMYESSDIIRYLEQRFGQ